MHPAGYHHSDSWQLQVRTCRVENPDYGAAHSGNLSGTDRTRLLYPTADRQLLCHAEAATEHFSQPGVNLYSKLTHYLHRNMIRQNSGKWLVVK